ncbi:MAG: hypothetical protein WKG07_04735 [Hymenobacter sp.]
MAAAAAERQRRRRGRGRAGILRARGCLGGQRPGGQQASQGQGQPQGKRT